MCSYGFATKFSHHFIRNLYVTILLPVRVCIRRTSECVVATLEFKSFELNSKKVWDQIAFKPQGCGVVVCFFFFWGGRGGTLIFSYIRRIKPFFGFKMMSFNNYLGFQKNE